MDCLAHAHVDGVVCKYFYSGMPSVLYKMSFNHLRQFDDWRCRPHNSTVIIHSLHIKYCYDKDFLSEDGCILK